MNSYPQNDHSINELYCKHVSSVFDVVLLAPVAFPLYITPSLNKGFSVEVLPSLNKGFSVEVLPLLNKDFSVEVLPSLNKGFSVGRVLPLLNKGFSVGEGKGSALVE